MAPPPSGSAAVEPFSYLSAVDMHILWITKVLCHTLGGGLPYPSSAML